MSASEEVVIWTRLAGTRQFLADALAEGRAIRQLGLESEEAGKRGFLMNQALFTARRFLYTGTIALVGFTAAAAVMGFQLNITMEESRIAFTRFLGSVGAANKELNYLYGFAARTPFTFQEVVAATRRFMAFGFTLRETNRYMGIIADTAAGLGGNTSDAISRMVLVFGQMRASGRVLGNDLLQLASLGINARASLQKAFNLTPKQMANIGGLGIPSELGIEVIMRDLDKHFRGMSAAQARTFRGRLSTLHDYAQQSFAAMTEPLFNNLRDNVFPRLIGFAKLMTETIKSRGFWGAIELLDSKMGAHGSFTTGVRLLVFWMGIFRDTLRRILPAVRAFLITLAPIITLLVIVTTGIGYLIRFANAIHLTSAAAYALAVILGLWLSRVILLRSWNLLLATSEALIAAPAFLRRIMLGNLLLKESVLIKKGQVFWTYRHLTAVQLETVMMNRNLKMTKANTIAILLYRRAMNLAAVATVIFTTAGGGMAGVLAVLRWGILGLTTAVYGLATSVVIFLATNPIGWAILLIAALGLLYWRWEAFRNTVNNLFSWVRDHWRLLGAILVAPFLALPLAMFAIFMRIRGYIGGLIVWVADRFRWLKGQFTGGGLRDAIVNGLKWAIPGYGAYRGIRSGLSRIPGLAEGGTVTQRGLTLVGERGPELISLSRGAQVTPLSGAGMQLEAVLMAPIRIDLDGRRLAESDAKWRLRVRSGNG